MLERDEILDTLSDLTNAVDRLIAGPINQGGPFDADGMGPISQAVGGEFIAALEVLDKHRPRTRRKVRQRR